MATKKIFIASTGQNVGKTTLSLGLIHLLKERFNHLSFMKPVGQEFVKMQESLHVDKDVELIYRHFNMHVSPSLMSPVLIPSVFTKEYLDGKITSDSLKEKVKSSFDFLCKTSDALVIEGTGHLGVGSIVDLNNAQVAHLLKAPIVLVCPGGLGSSFDELALNLALCEKYHAKISGVIINKVKPDKLDMISHYMKKALKSYNLPLLGCIPYDTLLSSPSFNDLAMLFEESLLTAKEQGLQHFENVRVLAVSAALFDGFLNGSQLLITPASREDIILAVLSKYWDCLMHQKPHVQVGMILTGNTPPSDLIIEKLNAAAIPMMHVQKTTHSVLKTINNFQAKIQQNDTEKILEAMKIVKESIDINALISAMS